MERIEHKVGEIFEFEEEKIITVEVEESLCYKCMFLFVGDCGGNKCLGSEREDGKNVIFQFADLKDVKP